MKIVLASNNPGKVREIDAMLEGSGIRILPQSDFAVESVAETGLTFVENALLKARHAAEQTGLPAIADDSGLVVDALNGAPGIHSARYAGEEASDEANLRKLLDVMADVPEDRRTARFVCLMVFLRHAADPLPLICQGIWEGRITTAPAGEGGFGYDPIFFLPDRGCTSAELPAEEKNRLSHRGRALRCLVENLKTHDH